MEKNLAVQSSKLRPKQLKKAQMKTTWQGPSHMMVTPNVHTVAMNSSKTFSCFPPRQSYTYLKRDRDRRGPGSLQRLIVLIQCIDKQSQEDSAFKLIIKTSKHFFFFEEKQNIFNYMADDRDAFEAQYIIQMNTWNALETDVNQVGRPIKN